LRTWCALGTRRSSSTCGPSRSRHALRASGSRRSCRSRGSLRTLDALLSLGSGRPLSTLGARRSLSSCRSLSTLGARRSWRACRERQNQHHRDGGHEDTSGPSHVSLRVATSLTLRHPLTEAFEAHRRLPGERSRPGERVTIRRVARISRGGFSGCRRHPSIPRHVRLRAARRESGTVNTRRSSGPPRGRSGSTLGRHRVRHRRPT
jgi:hypothetical protein